MQIIVEVGVGELSLALICLAKGRTYRKSAIGWLGDLPIQMLLAHSEIQLRYRTKNTCLDLVPAKTS